MMEVHNLFFILKKNKIYLILLFLQEEELKNAALLVLANKQDLPGALDAEQVSEALGLVCFFKNKFWTFNNIIFRVL